MYRKIALVFLFFLWAQAAFPQSGTLSGKLQDEKGAAVPFANVAVMTVADSALVTGTVTDAEGAFRISSPKAGKYFLRFSAIGYSTELSPAFEVSGKDFARNFGGIVLKEEAALLEEVSVEAMRPRVVVGADKMVVSVEGTAMAAGSSAFDVLSKSPGVWVDQDGNLQLNGRKGVEVMIDGRPTYLSAKELQTMLEGMSAENIKNIEIMANPSAKFDAEGTAGILNINLKKNTLSGMNGSLYAGYEYNNLHFYNAGANLNYKKGNWNSFVNLDMAKRGRLRNQHIIRSFSGENGRALFEQTGLENRKRFVPSLRAGTDYALNEQHSIGVMANLFYQDGANDWNTNSSLRNFGEEQTMLIESRNHFEDEFTNNTFNLHYNGKLDTAGTSLSASLDYVRLSEEENNLFLNSYSFPVSNTTRQEDIRTTSNSAYSIYSARTDLQLPLSKNTKIEAGVKASHVLSESKLLFYEQEEGKESLHAGKSNEFTYQEEIYAAYMNFSSRLNSTWNIQGGLRAEQTMGEGTSLMENKTNTRSYLDLFPSLFVKQKVSDKYQLAYSYSRRITRPNYSKLNPSIFYLDPYTYVVGNPQLRPQYTHALQLTQTFLNTYNLVLGMDHTSDFFGEVPLLDEESGQTVLATRNMDGFRNYSATIVAPVQLLPSWSMNNNLVMAHQQYNTIIDDSRQENKQFFLMAQSNQQLKLPMAIMLEVNAAYRGPVAYGLYRVESQWWVDAGLKRSFMNDKVDLSLNVTDIFRTMEMAVSSEVNDYKTTIDQYFNNRGIRLNLRYSFHKGEKFDSQNRKVELEELNRAGG